MCKAYNEKKRETTVEIELSNQENIETLKEKKNLQISANIRSKEH